MKCVVNMNELSNFSNSFTNFCNKELLTSFNNLENIFNNVSWEGKGYESYKAVYDKGVKHLKANLEKLYFYAYFCKYSSTMFKEANKMANINFNDIREELNDLLEKLGDL